MTYTVKSESLIRAKERAANVGSEADSFLNEFLDLSARTDSSGQTHYAVFLAAAVWLEQSPQYQLLSQAENGVKFTQMVSAIASLRSLQFGYDSRYQLVVPPGFEVAPLATTQTSMRERRVFGSSTLKTVVMP